MKRLLLAMVLTVACALALTGCASGAAHYTGKTVTGTTSLYDNFTKDCTRPDTLAYVGPVDSVWVRCEWWQDAARVKADSVQVRRGLGVAFAPPDLTRGTTLTAAVYVRDVGGTSCAATKDQTPTIVYLPPARAVLTTP